MSNDTNTPRLTTPVSGGEVGHGDLAMHKDHGLVSIAHSKDLGWHYLRMGYAGHGNDFENMSVITSPDAIVLVGPAFIADQKGRMIPITQITIDAESYIPDVAVTIDWKAFIKANPKLDLDLDDTRDFALYDDDKFIAGVMAQLRNIGYEGEDFGRAELGLQSDDGIVLEPGTEFSDFAMTKGWKYTDGLEEYLCNKVIRDVKWESKLEFTDCDGTEFSIRLQPLIENHSKQHKAKHGGSRDQIMTDVSIPMFKNNPQEGINWLRSEADWTNIFRMVEVKDRHLPDPKRALEADEGASVKWVTPKNRAQP
jgi:hypothetical protein